MDIPKDVVITYFQRKIDDNHRDSFWYGATGKGVGQMTDVAKLMYKERIVYVDAPGDILLVISEDEREIRGPGDVTCDELSAGDIWLWGLTSELESQLGAIKGEWINNNWFENFYSHAGWGETFAEEGEVCYDYDEAIAAAVDLIKDDAWWAEHGEA